MFCTDASTPTHFWAGKNDYSGENFCSKCREVVLVPVLVRGIEGGEGGGVEGGVGEGVGG